MSLSGLSVCLAYTKPWVRYLVPHKSNMVERICNPCIQEVQAGGSGAQGHNEVKVSLDWSESVWGGGALSRPEFNSQHPHRAAHNCL